MLMDHAMDKQVGGKPEEPRGRPKGKQPKYKSGHVFPGSSLTLESRVIRNGLVCWTCRCECDPTVITRAFRQTHLSCGAVKSCRSCSKRPSSYFRRRPGDVHWELTLLRRIPSDKWRNNTRWVCKCSCGAETRPILLGNITSGHTKTCGGSSHVKSGKDSATFTGHEEVHGKFMYSVSSRANDAGRSCTVTAVDVWNIYVAQWKRCFYTGLPIHFYPGPKDMAHEQTASLERLDSSLGYDVGNVVLVHKDLNLMKRGFTIKRFLTYCRLVTENFPCPEDIDFTSIATSLASRPE